MTCQDAVLVNLRLARHSLALLPDNGRLHAKEI
jgi:hypothetical protein